MTMTHYALRGDLSFCQVGERMVFLDIESDRYFHLPPAMERTLAAYLKDDGQCELDISDLVERKILVERTETAISTRPSIKPAIRSAMEVPFPTKRLRLSELLEVLAIVLYTRLQLKLSTLKNVLGGLTADSCIQTAQATIRLAPAEHRLLDVAAVYRRARLYIPVEMRCLLDSVAMARFFRRRQLETHVVFGVALDPFSAHCWVQADDLVLNDTVGNVDAHTPIRVV
jgi:hypothetical protein